MFFPDDVNDFVLLEPERVPVVGAWGVITDGPCVALKNNIVCALQRSIFFIKIRGLGLKIMNDIPDLISVLYLIIPFSYWSLRIVF